LLWAIELQPGKEYTTTPDFDLHVTQAVLPAAAQDKARSVVSVRIDEASEKKSFAIASLKLDSHESHSVDLVFDAEEGITFSVSGKNPVHLSGYLIPPQQGGEDFEFDDDEDDEDIASQDEDELEGEEGDEDADEEAIQAEVANQVAKRKGQAGENGAPAQKKPKQEPAKQEPAKQEPVKQEKPKAEQKAQPQQATPKTEGKKPQQQQQQQKSPAQAQQKDIATKTIDGIVCTTLKEGQGKEAKKGNRVFVKYIGKLTKNGKVFDRSTDSAFNFNLGRGEVIKGWDLGVAGMKIGEKRKLVIPPQHGYGARGALPEIPPNASLTFEVELVAVK